MRALVETYGPDGPGYTAAAFEALCADVSGLDLRGFFAEHVRGTGELDFESALAPFGLRLRARPRKGGARVRDLLGLRLQAAGGRLVIETVERGSAGEAAGLSARDEIVALDGYRVTAEELARRLNARPPRASATIAVFRDDELRSFDVVLPAAPAGEWVVEEDGGANAAARDALRVWLAEPAGDPP
jgi:predicted metalloprotease with PDZ domain